jgi:hypothetical protein
MKPYNKLKGSGANRYKDNPTCPCGKSNRDGKFVSYVGLEGLGKGYCHSCGNTFKEGIESIIEPAMFKKEEIPNFCSEDIGDLKKYFDAKLESSFAQSLVDVHGKDKAIDIVQKYYLGLYDYKRVIFWQLDEVLNLRAGKVMAYNDKGKRIGNPNWWSSIHKKSCKMQMCFFGQHLIAEQKRRIAVVESEKTACHMDVFNPSYTWLATGGKTQLNHAKCSEIAQYDVTLYPDHDAYDQWKVFADEWGFNISKDCEYWFEQGLISKGEDIADYYLNLLGCLCAYLVEVDDNVCQEEIDSIFNKPEEYRSDIYTGRFPP